MKVGDQVSFEYARRLIKQEGFLCGGSSGTAMAAAVEYIKKNNIGEGKRCVILCPDNIRNYITKFINNDWMYEHGFITEQECQIASEPKLVPNDAWGRELKISDMQLHEAVFLRPTMSCGDAIVTMKKDSYDQYPVQEEGGDKVLGLLTAATLMSKLAHKKVDLADPISKIMTKDFRNMSSEMPISELVRVLERQNFVLVDGKSIASSYDLLGYMAARNMSDAAA